MQYDSFYRSLAKGRRTRLHPPGTTTRLWQGTGMLFDRPEIECFVGPDHLILPLPEPGPSPTPVFSHTWYQRVQLDDRDLCHITTAEGILTLGVLSIPSAPTGVWLSIAKRRPEGRQAQRIWSVLLPTEGSISLRPNLTGDQFYLWTEGLTGLRTFRFAGEQVISR